MKEMMKNTLTKAAESLTDVTNTQLDMGIGIVDCFPACFYDTIVVGGKTYRVKVEVNVTEVEGA